MTKQYSLFDDESEELEKTVKADIKNGLTSKIINDLIGVDESFHASYKLLELLQQKESREDLFVRFLKYETDLSFDWFTNYFQEEHSDRKQKKQDFTPDGVVALMSKILGETTSNIDICAGTGGLTIKVWNNNKGATFVCEEFSDRAIPFLLFNLSIRNMEARVFHGDALSRKAKAIYQLNRGDKYSDIVVVDFYQEPLVDTVIMNPPYSMEWEHLPEYKFQKRFSEYGLAPKSKADFAFLLQGLSCLKNGGRMVIILPTGVLFRSGQEMAIRKRLIELGFIKSVITLPEKLFLNTTIPTIILVIERNDKDILFISAEEKCVNKKPINVLTNENVNTIYDTFKNNTIINGFSKLVGIAEIQKNDFNLNMARYIYREPERNVPSYEELIKEMKELKAEIKSTGLELSKMFDEIVSTSKDKTTVEAFEKFKKEIKEFL